jgi:Secretion system C-terminal sorting domain
MATKATTKVKQSPVAPVTGGNKIQSIKVFDVLGKIVFKSEPLNNQSTINSSQFAKGIYFVQITDENKNVVNRKIVIN